MKFVAENLGRHATGLRARIRDGRNVFVNFRGRWEWYVVNARGGLEEWHGYVDQERHTRVLDNVFLLPPKHDPSQSLPSQRTNDWAKELIPKGERCYRLVDDPDRFEVVELGRSEKCGFHERRSRL